MNDDLLRDAQLVELTQPLGPQTPLWSATERFRATTQATHDSDSMYYRYLELPEHSGTHLDAPIHFAEGGATTEEIPLTSLMVPVAVADVRDHATADDDFAYGEAHLSTFEAEHGKVAEGSAFLLCTGWDRHRADPELYIRSMRFPGFGADAAEALVDRGAVGIGIDTLSVDAGIAGSFPVHNVTQPNGLWHLEGLIDLDRLPPTGAWLVAAPLLLSDGSGSPARVFAIVPATS